MPTVRCPSCQRALNLPESHAEREVCCPLCRTTFPAVLPAAPLRVPTLARSVPVSVPVPSSESGGAPGEAPFNFEPDVSASLPPGDREALRKAANWLKAHAGFGVIHLFTCGCVNVMAFGAMAGVGGERYLTGAALDVLLRLAAFGIIAAGAESLDRRRSRALATTAAVLALLTGGYLLLGPTLIALAMLGAFRRSSPLSEEAVPVACVSLAMTLLVAALGLVGGIRSLVLLGKPEVLRAFQRPPQRA